MRCSPFSIKLLSVLGMHDLFEKSLRLYLCLCLCPPPPFPPYCRRTLKSSQLMYFASTYMTCVESQSYDGTPVSLAHELTRIDGTHNDEARDDETQSDQSDEEDTAPTGREFTADDPILYIVKPGRSAEIRKKSHT